MKKIVLMMLVAMIPVITMAQKRSKKDKNIKSEKIVESNSSYEFMIITGFEIHLQAENRGGAGNEVKNSVDERNQMMRSKSKIKVDFDFGAKTNEIPNLLRQARNFRTMAAAVNAAANEGWDFVSSDVILSGKNKFHYYYMRRNK